MSQLQITINLPLDSDGFLRRACPSCGREFKWLPTEGEEQPSDNVAYFCPYCGKPASPRDWFTEEQAAYLNAQVIDAAYENVLRPSLDGLTKSFEQLGQASGGLIQITAKVDKPKSQQAPPVFEPNDMARVDFNCHPQEPVKVSETWDDSIYCLYCGSLADASS